MTAEALHENSLPVWCLMMEAGVLVLTFLPQPPITWNRWDSWRISLCQMRKQGLSDVRGCVLTWPSCDPNRSLLKFCHSDQKPLECAKINQTGKRLVVCPEKNSHRTWAVAPFSVCITPHKKSLSFGTCYTVFHCWWYLIFPAIKIHLHDQLSGFVPAQM